MIKKALRWIYDLRSRKGSKFQPRTVSIFTLSLGREFYLDKLIQSMHKNIHLPYQHIILNQGIKDADFISFLKGLERNNKNIQVVYADENLGINAGCKRCVSDCTGDLIIKLDEDMAIVSDNFLKHLLAAYNSIAEPVALSAFPVGIIRNPGGVPTKYGHSVYYSKETDTYYTIRWVHYLGGACECFPKIIFDKAKLFEGFRGKKTSGQDVFISRKMRKAGFRLGYLENACIAEHQESTLGQEERFKEYFKNKGKPS